MVIVIREEVATKTTANNGVLVMASPVGDRMGCNQDKAIAKKKQSKEVGSYFHDERFRDEHF